MNLDLEFFNAKSLREKRYHAAQSLLDNPPPANLEKIAQRKKHLEDHPEAKKRIDLNTLKSIIDYKWFKCDPRSSIARDQAILGSDIDGGLVVTDRPVTVDKQLEFINELRNQGFNVYHKNEYRERKAAYESYQGEDKQLEGKLRNDYFNSNHVLDFVDYKRAEEVCNMEEMPNDSGFFFVYLIGSNIDDMYNAK